MVSSLGYIEVDITFPSSFTGEDKTVRAVALIVPDYKTHSEISVLIGTNILDILSEDFREEMRKGRVFLSIVPMLLSSDTCRPSTEKRKNMRALWGQLNCDVRTT